MVYFQKKEEIFYEFKNWWMLTLDLDNRQRGLLDQIMSIEK